MSDEDVWFEPKLFGYGSGLPVRWQGWAVLAAYLVAVSVAALTLAERHRALLIAAVLLISVPLMVVSAQHTRGGWRWRWGREGVTPLTGSRSGQGLVQLLREPESAAFDL